MASLAHVERWQVVHAIAEHDSVGVDQFLASHGYRDSKTWRIRYRGNSYPSKAILGVAAGLSSSEFFGGIAQTVPALIRLGFEVRKGERRATASTFDNLVASVRFDDVDPGHELTREPAGYFLSGSNRPGEIRGLASSGKDIGVAAQELSEEAILELEALAGSDVRVFVDSGAFTELKTGVEPNWSKVLGTYKRLGAALGDQLWCVAPDKIGDQMETLRRLDAHVWDLHAIASTGARILVPMQKGRAFSTQAIFARMVDAVLRSHRLDWIPAFPCNAAATTPDEARAFVRERKPAHVHMLGLGPRRRPCAGSPYWARDYVDALEGTSYTLDSSWIAASTGKKNKAGDRRRYSAARDVATGLLAAAGLAGAGLVAELGMLIAFGGVA